jgi:hypothetical protein
MLPLAGRHAKVLPTEIMPERIWIRLLLPLIEKQKRRNSDISYNPSYAFTFSRSIKTENRKTSLQGLI